MKIFVVKHKNITLLAGLLAACAIFYAVSYPSAVGAYATDRQLPIYCVEKDQKVCSISFDAAWGNEDTQTLIDILEQYKVKATFFVVGNYLETSPDLVKRMLAEGHTVGNHTYHHPDMSKIRTKEDFARELEALETLYEEITGEPISKYYRPPQGIYSEKNLQMAKDLGYRTFFWSLAYVDWKQDDQPTHEQAFDKLLTRVHPGAVVLLHNTSKTNGEILDELLAKWEEMGYTFHPLSELCGA